MDYHKRNEHMTYPCNLTQKSDMTLSRVTRSCFGCLFVLLLVWNVLLHVQTSRHSEQIERLQEEHLELRGRFLQGHRSKRALLLGDGSGWNGHVGAEAVTGIDDIDSGDVEGAQTDNLDEVASTEGVFASLLERHRREAQGRTQQTGGNRRRGAKGGKRNKRQKSRGKKDSAAQGAHFAAFVDEDKLKREQIEGIAGVGKRNADGTLTPSDDVFRFWKKADWTSDRAFRYAEETGKVTIKHQGFYLVYGQIVFHGSSARKSYGIHINDDLVPFIESIAFDNIMEPRVKRDVTSVDDVIHTNSTVDHGSRHKRTTYSSYSQCNTLAVTYLKENDTVFLKSIKPQRPIITQSYLTFWGIAKL